jgi:4-hydroxythreonine-4-phosphate dehydrogenase
MEATRPLVAVTMGDPAGVGPEVVLGALADRRVRAACRPVVIGDLRVLRQAAHGLGKRPAIKAVGDLAEVGAEPHTRCVLDLRNADPASVPPGRVSAEAGRAAAEYIGRAAQFALAGAVEAMATAPISKEALRLAGLPYPGHTEMLKALCGAGEVAMMLVHGNMRVSHVTTHVSVREACLGITRARVLTVIRLTQAALAEMGLPRRRIAVAGLNPHAGESGLFGEEEQTAIAPAIADATAQGLDVIGPLPPDTVFARHRAGEFDAVVAMLHDHGHIGVKTAAFAVGRGGRLRTAGVNLTLGLPIIRTSVDHGTAFDIAGQGVADPTSMVEAILLAAQMAQAGREQGLRASGA